MASLLVISPKGSRQIVVNGLQTIGGAKGSGIRISDLKQKNDYIVVSKAEAKIQIHNLMGKTQQNIELSHLQSITIEDLTIVAICESLEKEDLASFDNLYSLLSVIQKNGNFLQAMDQILSSLCQALHLQFGFIVTKEKNEEFAVTNVLGLNRNDKWLSEKLVVDVLSTKSKVAINNILGSPYQNNKTLIASGFLSLFAYPLEYQGISLGVLLVGSRLPHDGLKQAEEKFLDVATIIASILLHHYLQEELLKQEVSLQRSKTKQTVIQTEDKALLENLEIADKVAKTDVAILIQGETGVGKELLAQDIHQKSERAKAAFVAINCGAIPSELLESLLFGHKKGSFTGAVADQIGQFQKAQGGTLFLDEVADLPLQLQVKLLRVLQEKKVEPLGSQKVIPVDVRILSASHKNLPILVKQGLFRADLYYRLAEVTITIPSLRDRVSDVILLTNQFLKAEGFKKSISKEALTWLCSQTWSGNVRELHSALRRAFILSKDAQLNITDFLIGRPESISSNENQMDNWLGGENLDQARDKFVHAKVKLALIKAEGKRNKAAELLGVTPRTLFRYLDEMGNSGIEV